jgi:predicted nuclease with TOPRIM domain
MKSFCKRRCVGLKRRHVKCKRRCVGLKRRHVKQVKGDVSGLKEKVDEMDKKLNAVYEQTAFLTEFKEEISKNNKRIEQENRRLKEIVGRHELEIQDLKQKIG